MDGSDSSAIRPHAFGLIYSKGDSSEVVKNTAAEQRKVRTRKVEHPRIKGAESFREEIEDRAKDSRGLLNWKALLNLTFQQLLRPKCELFCQCGQEPDCSGLQSEGR